MNIEKILNVSIIDILICLSTNNAKKMIEKSPRSEIILTSPGITSSSIETDSCVWPSTTILI